MRTKRASKTVQEVKTDGRIWPLLDQYCKLAKVKLIARGADLYDMKLPLSERVHFSGRAMVRVGVPMWSALKASRVAIWSGIACSSAHPVDAYDEPASA